MGAAKSNPLAITAKGKGRFDPVYQGEAEADLCLHHAVAFERVTGWPVHATYGGADPIRFYNEDGWTGLFDVRGIMSAAQHWDIVLHPIAMSRNWVRTESNAHGIEFGSKCIGEDGVVAAGLELNAGRIEAAEAVIRANHIYLGYVAERVGPRFPARSLQRYAFGKCVVFAEALGRVRGLPAVTMLPTAVAQGVHIEADQMQHAVVLHPDGEVEDVWGKVPVERIANRYSFTGWTLSEKAHRAMIEEALAEHPAVADDVRDAETLIRATISQAASG